MVARYIALTLAALLVTLSTGASAKDIVHKVSSGQNLGMIAKRYHTHAETIRRHNGLKKKQILRVGQKLRVPESREHKKWRRFVEKKNEADKPKKKTAKKKKKIKKTAKKKTKKKVKKTAKKVKKSKAKKNKWWRRGHKKGFVRVVRHNERFIGQLVNKKGRVIKSAGKRLDRILRSKKGKRRHIDRRLMKLLAETSDHFGGRTVIVISGYRPYSKKQFTKNSRHNHGKAIDFRIVGVPNDELYRFCQRHRRVGCGHYPNSTFVHMDVRKRKTRWTDYSKPGQKPVYARKSSKKKKAAKKEEEEDERLKVVVDVFGFFARLGLGLDLRFGTRLELRLRFWLGLGLG